MGITAMLRRICVSGLVLAAGAASSAPTSYGFVAQLDSGPLQGTRFPGSFSFDPAAGTGVGREFLPLATFEFTLLGTHFTRDDIRQGGQVILDDGVVSYFTAALFPASPPSPVSDIAFGFGGPDVIGYAVPSSTMTVFGLGTYRFFAAPVPEPDTLVLLTLGLLPVAARRLRRSAPADLFA